MAGLRPMLAASFDNPQEIEPELQFLKYPLLASPKIDGIRWMKPPGEPAMSRSWKPLPNMRFQEFMTAATDVLSFLDGEVIVGDDPTKIGLFNETQSCIMTRDDDRLFSLWVFDSWVDSNTPFVSRTLHAKCVVEEARRQGLFKVNYVEHKALYNPQEVLAYEEEALLAGYEGIMLRDPEGTYKYGRSTMKQQGLIKVKRYADDEAIIVGFEELERNQNEATKDAFGLQRRSSHKAGRVAGGTLGKFILEHPKWGRFTCGSGLDDDTRAKIWNDQAQYLGKTVSFKYQAHGTKDKPRTPIFKGLRSD